MLPARTGLSVVTLSVFLVLLTACGSKSSSNNNGNGGGGAGATQNAQGTVALPNGSLGVAIVHIEDNSGNLLPQLSSTNVAAAGAVTIISEPPDFSQGIIVGSQTVQTLNTADTTPQVTDNLAVTSDGVPLSASVIPGSTFSVVQMSQVAGYLTTCFTGGLHMTTGGQPGNGQPTEIAYNVSPDGTGMIAAGAAGSFDFYLLSPVTGAHGETIANWFSLTGPVPSVSGRGAFAWNPTSDTVLAGGQDGSLNAFSALKTTQPVQNTINLPGNVPVTSIAYLPNGNYAIAATTSGLFTLSISSSGVPAVVLGPISPSYTGSDGQTYQLDHAQSVAVTSDGKFLVALTDQPNPTNGTLVVMPVDASGNISSVGATQGGYLATQGVDVLFAH